MSDTITQECTRCGFETDCIEGLCQECVLELQEEYEPDEEWMNAPLGKPTTPTQIPEDIDPNYEAMMADLP